MGNVLLVDPAPAVLALTAWGMPFAEGLRLVSRSFGRFRASPIAGAKGRGIRCGMGGRPKLVASNLSITYQLPSGRDFIAVQNLSLNVYAAEFVCIVGPSGCGKSTFLGACAGFVPVAKGELLIDGHPVQGPGRDRGVVFQHPSLFPWRTALENVVYGLELAGVPREERYRTGRDLLRLVRLDGFADRFPYQLSGGMQQRVNLARALAIQPTLLLFDEPFAALDAQTREFMQVELLRIWEATGQTALFVTHDINEAIYLADRVVVMTPCPGRVREEIPIDLPRPRPLSVKRSVKFLQYEERIWDYIAREFTPTKENSIS